MIMLDNRLVSALFFCSQISDIGWTCGGFPNCVFIYLVNIASSKSDNIFCMESREQFNVIILLWGLTKSCQYASQLVFFSCAIVSSRIWPVFFQLCSNILKLGIDLGFPYLIKPEVCNICLIILTILFDMPDALAIANSACFTCVFQLVKRISL